MTDTIKSFIKSKPTITTVEEEAKSNNYWDLLNWSNISIQEDSAPEVPFTHLVIPNHCKK